MKNKPTYNGIEFDSMEEIEFYWWIEEAMNEGFIYNIHQQVEYNLSPRQSMEITKQLKTKTKKVDKFLLHPHKYTSDFEFQIGEKWFDYNMPFILNEAYFLIVDVKGSFNQHGGDREFSINQKWLFQQPEPFNIIQLITYIQL